MSTAEAHTTEVPTHKRQPIKKRSIDELEAPLTAVLPQEIRAKVVRRNNVAYLCMEFAVREGLELYSGGLGILAGDVVKTAYDRDLPIIGIGILWDEGYTSQHVDAAGHVVDTYPKSDRSQMVQVVIKDGFSVTAKGEDIALRAFTVEGLGSKLYLIEPEDEELRRRYTSRLYQGTDEDRLVQETILGVGAVRLLRALGLPVEYFHFNEGHAVFAGLELIREKLADGKVSFDEAVKATKKECLFTTHTPVKAGNETHPVELVEKIGGKHLSLTAKQLQQIGSSPFSMTEAAFYLSCRYNAVSQLHKETAMDMWKHLDPAPEILGITNGVHVPSWQDKLVREAFEAECAEREQTQGEMTAPKCMKDDELWKMHQKAKKELLDEIYTLTGIQLSLDHLLVGFARRAASYKRHTLLFHQKAEKMRTKIDKEKAEEMKTKIDKEKAATAAATAEVTDKTAVAAENEKELSSSVKDKLEETVTASEVTNGAQQVPEKDEEVEPTAEEKAIEDALDTGRLQVVFSGKAHPQDDAGKMQIRLLRCQQKDTPKGLLYLENYNMKLGRLLTRGCDVWLNNPKRPMEASGTSGMKAAMNGVLNCSILDGWWPEGCEHGVTGWQIGEGETYGELEDGDTKDGNLLHKVTVEDVMPTYYDDEEKVKWRTMMRRSIAMSQWKFSSDRMISDYFESLYKWH